MNANIRRGLFVSEVAALKRRSRPKREALWQLIILIMSSVFWMAVMFVRCVRSRTHTYYFQFYVCLSVCLKIYYYIFRFFLMPCWEREVVWCSDTADIRAAAVFVVYLTTLSAQVTIISEYRIGKDVEGIDCRPISVLSRRLRGETEVNPENRGLVQAVFWL